MIFSIVCFIFFILFVLLAYAAHIAGDKKHEIGMWSIAFLFLTFSIISLLYESNV